MERAFVLNDAQRHARRRLRSGELPRHQQPLQPELRRRFEQQPDVVLRSLRSRLRRPIRLLHRLSIKEFQANAATYSAEFGKAAGGQVNAITKSGTNHFHGDAFYYLRYPDLNAFDPYNKYQALHNNGNSFLLTQPVHQQQQFGGSISADPS
jgi:hypothetical protein